MESCPSISCFLNEQFTFIFCFAAVLSMFFLSMTAVSIQNYCKLRRLSPEGRMKARIITNRCETFIQSQLEISSKDKILRLVWNFFKFWDFSVRLFHYSPILSVINQKLLNLMKLFPTISVERHSSIYDNQFSVKMFYFWAKSRMFSETTW